MNKTLNIGTSFPLEALLLTQYSFRYLDTFCFPKKKKKKIMGNDHSMLLTEEFSTTYLVENKGLQIKEWKGIYTQLNYSVYCQLLIIASRLHIKPSVCALQQQNSFTVGTVLSFLCRGHWGCCRRKGLSCVFGMLHGE